VRTITLNNNIEVEVELTSQQAQEISVRHKLDSSIEEIMGSFRSVLQPIMNSIGSLEFSDDVASAKLSVGLKFGVEGNLILAKSTGEAHIVVELTMK